MHYWLNGQPVSAIPADCRGLHYGDGHFTTMAVRSGQLQLWSLHQQRLAQGCERLRLPPPDWAQTEALAKAVAAELDSGVIKLTLFRGAGGRGYSARGCGPTQWLLSTSPWPAHAARWQQAGVELGICEQRLAASPLLAGLKHLNRLEQVLLRQEADSKGWQEALVLDTSGYVIEACSANLLWSEHGQWYTPDVSTAGVAGVMRQQVARILQAQGRVLSESQLTWPQLQQAEAVAICNAVIGIVPVTRIEQQDYDPAPVRLLASQLGSFLS